MLGQRRNDQPRHEAEEHADDQPHQLRDRPDAGKPQVADEDPERQREHRCHERGHQHGRDDDDGVVRRQAHARQHRRDGHHSDVVEAQRRALRDLVEDLIHQHARANLGPGRHLAACPGRHGAALAALPLPDAPGARGGLVLLLFRRLVGQGRQHRAARFRELNGHDADGAALREVVAADAELLCQQRQDVVGLAGDCPEHHHGAAAGSDVSGGGAGHSDVVAGRERHWRVGAVLVVAGAVGVRQARPPRPARRGHCLVARRHRSQRGHALPCAGAVSPVGQRFPDRGCSAFRLLLRCALRLLLLLRLARSLTAAATGRRRATATAAAAAAAAAGDGGKRSRRRLSLRIRLRLRLCRLGLLSVLLVGGVCLGRHARCHAVVGDRLPVALAGSSGRLLLLLGALLGLLCGLGRRLFSRRRVAGRVRLGGIAWRRRGNSRGVSRAANAAPGSGLAVGHARAGSGGWRRARRRAQVGPHAGRRREPRAAVANDELGRGAGVAGHGGS
mmetsp:Transcript_4415/g.18730  ORF Transcript_4415/g.18730 Transcript_4415/m.18730 type:complete len:504 (-) Transcript_4415:301-1812(-)